MANGADRQRKHRERMAERGVVQISVKVPADKLDLVKRFAARLRWKHETTIIHD
jgi:hypothetical protein